MQTVLPVLQLAGKDIALTGIFHGENISSFAMFLYAVPKSVQGYFNFGVS